jgi:hypothetical protein
MTTTNIRDQLHTQIDHLPADIVEQIADFTLFVMSRRQITPLYTDWTHTEWQTFSLEQFFREEDEVAYSLADAQEIYHP